ncbi:hypothetical protein [Maricaulis sp. CAU 1757]
MAIRSRHKLWTRVGTVALVGGLASCGDPATVSGSDSPATVETRDSEAPAPVERAAQRFSEGEGEGDGGGGGGEFGIDPVAASTDPVVFLTAIEVMRAHYLAGIDALEAGNRTAGAEMFAHPISEIYIDLEPALEEVGAELFSDALTEASVAPYSGAADEEIRARIDDVLSALDTASSHAPSSAMSDGGVHARVLADLIQRAALQYETAAAQPRAGEAYLDGYGFQKAARRYAGNHLEAVATRDADLAMRIGAALGALDRAYPGALPPETLDMDAVRLLEQAAAVQAGALAVN